MLKNGEIVNFCRVLILFVPPVILIVVARENNREGWPLLTVETEVNGDSKSTNERGPSLVGSQGSSYRYKRLLSCLGCVQFFPRRTLFQFLCPLGRESCRATCLSECVSPSPPPPPDGNSNQRPYFAASNSFEQKYTYEPNQKKLR